MKKSFLMGISLLFAQQNFAAIQKQQMIVEKNKIIVAIIDTGADIQHKELKNSIWTNAGETGLDKWGHDKSTNNIDDDGNGFVDDIHGWNFVDNNNDLLDSMGHGTHISGIIKNESSKSPFFKKNDAGVKLMILKYYNPDSSDSDNIENTVKAINYAVKMKADIINYSGGGSLPSYQERTAIEKAQVSHILFVAAAGNNKNNTDIRGYYPANYKLNNIISVAASDNSGELVDFSNYGKNSIDIAAPGKNIFSTLPNNKYGFMSGTSQSTAYVTGVIANHLLTNSSRDPEVVLKDIVQTAHYNKSLVGKTKFQVALTNSVNNQL